NSSSKKPGGAATPGADRAVRRHRNDIAPHLPPLGMPLPALIEIVPLEKPLAAEISVPGSKSITNRALVLAALAEGATTLRGALWSEDTQVMARSLETLGFSVRVELDPDEVCNRAITV